jgi:hypothetical protein
MGKIGGVMAVAILTCSYANAGMAQVAATVPATSYPDPQCTKPDVNLVKQPKPEGNGPDDVAAYNAKARKYNSQVKAFNQGAASYRSCVRDYVDNASREVKRIQDQANADMKRITDSSNAAMDTIQAKIKRAVTELNDLAAQESSP